MLPPQQFARRARTRRARGFLAAQDVLEIRMVPAVIGPTSQVSTSSQLIRPVGSSITPDAGGASPVGYTPQQIRTAYGIDDIQFGSITGDGAGQTIAIVNAYDDPALIATSSPDYSTSDLAEFDRAFGLPDPPSFAKVNQFGSTTNLPGADPAGPGNGPWEAEEAMDVEWAHAIAPDAKIILVEADSNSSADLYNAVARAADLPGVSTISVSWGSAEFAGESGYDAFFQTPSGHQGVTFVAATGDGGAPGIYPAYSPNVVAAGGTGLNATPDGYYESENAWSESGGGVSTEEAAPAYQDGVQSTGDRTIPDVAFDAQYNTGVAVYDSYDNGGADPWVQMGGTSLAAPTWAALIAIADQGRVAMGGTTLDGPSQTLPALYSLPSADFHDVAVGNNGYPAGPGYDDVTGLGTPIANRLVPDLAAYGMSDQLVVATQPSGSVTAGSSFGLTVDVEDAGGQLMTGATGTLTLSLVDDPGGAALNGTLTAPIEDGVATFSGLSIDGAGTGYAVRVTGESLDPATSDAFDVVPAAASQVVFGGEPPSSVTAGAGFGLAVDVEDIYGNLASGFDGGVTLSVGSDPTGADLGGDLTMTFRGGVADFSGLTLDRAGAGYTIMAFSGNLSAAATMPFDVTSAAGTQLVISSGPAQSLTAGTGFGLAVSVEDAYGDLETGYDGDVTVALAGGPGGAALGGTLTVPINDDVADFSGLTLDRTGSGYTLEVTSNGLAAATTTAFAVTPSAPAQLAITDQPPSSVTAGAGFGLSVTVEDAFGNAEPGASGNVSVALTPGSTGASLGGTLTTTVGGGVASFSGLTLDQAGSGYTLQVSGTGLTGVSTSAFQITPAAASQLVTVVQPPSSVTAGQGFGFTVAAEDPFGNVVTGFDGTVTASLSGASLSGPMTATASQGLASFSGLMIGQAGAGYTLGATAGNLSPAVAGPLSVSPAAAIHLVVTAQPPGIVTAGNGFGVTVAAEDPFGNVVTSFQGPMTATLSGVPGSGTLGGNTTATAVDGVAQFSGLLLTTATYGDRLVLTSGGLSATTNTITVDAGAPSQWVIVTQPPATVSPGQNIVIVAAVEDVYGNVVYTENGTASLSLAEAPTGGKLQGSTTVPLSAGVAVFDESASNTPGTYSVSVAGDSLPARTSNTFHVVGVIDPAASVFSFRNRRGETRAHASRTPSHRGH